MHTLGALCVYSLWLFLQRPRPDDEVAGRDVLGGAFVNVFADVAVLRVGVTDGLHESVMEGKVIYLRTFSNNPLQERVG